MMPYCARNPPTAPALSTLVLKNYALEDHSSSSEVQIYYASRSWRRRITSLVILGTLLTFFTMIAAFADTSGFESVLDRSAMESETGRPSPSNDSKFIRPSEFMPKRTKRGLTRTNQQQSVPSLKSKDRPQYRLHHRHGAGRRFTFLDGRRILVSSACTNKDISIFQSPDGSSGIPRYAVQIMNNCMSDCAPSNIHVFCGWFASALLVNPNSFKRIAFDDCVVNGGKPLKHGETLRFTYANSFMYPLRFKSASFCK